MQHPRGVEVEPARARSVDTAHAVDRDLFDERVLFDPPPSLPSPPPPRPPGGSGSPPPLPGRRGGPGSPPADTHTSPCPKGPPGGGGPAARQAKGKAPAPPPARPAPRPSPPPQGGRRRGWLPSSLGLLGGGRANERSIRSRLGQALAGVPSSATSRPRQRCCGGSSTPRSTRFARCSTTPRTGSR